MKQLTIVATLALLAGCSGTPNDDSAPAASGGPEPVTTESPAASLPEGALAIGESVTDAPRVALADVRKSPDDYVDGVVIVEATATDVCQSKGCWMTVTDAEGAEPIWVRWSTGCGGKYAFPKDAAGRKILVQGTLSAKEITAEAAEHLASESENLEADAIQGATFEIDATACVLLPETATGSS